MMARMSMAALSTPGPKNCMAWISGWCSSGRIWFECSSMYRTGFSTIFLYHFSHSFRANNLAPKLSSFLGLLAGALTRLPAMSTGPTVGTWSELLSAVPERNLLWWESFGWTEVSAWCWDLSRHGRSSFGSSSYLLRAAGPKLSRFSGLGRLRRTDFTTNLSLGEGSGGSGSLGGWDRDLSVCRLPIWETSQDGSTPLDLPRLGSTTPRAGGNCSFSSFLLAGSPSLVGWHAMLSFLTGVDLVAEVLRLIPANGSAREYWTSSSCPHSSGCSGGCTG